MAAANPARRLPLRDLMTDAEKRARDLMKFLTDNWLARAGDLRDLSRPLRKRSHYPTYAALRNAIQKLGQMTQEVGERVEYLTQQMEHIREHAQRERLNRR